MKGISWFIIILSFSSCNDKFKSKAFEDIFGNMYVVTIDSQKTDQFFEVKYSYKSKNSFVSGDGIVEFVEFSLINYKFDHRSNARDLALNSCLINNVPFVSMIEENVFVLVDSKGLSRSLNIENIKKIKRILEKMKKHIKLDNSGRWNIECSKY